MYVYMCVENFTLISSRLKLMLEMQLKKFISKNCAAHGWKIFIYKEQRQHNE